MTRRTMMSDSLNWEEIKLPTKSYNVRLIPETSALPIYIGKDINGHCLLIIELNGDHTEYFNKNMVALIGISLDLRFEAGVQNFILTLESHSNRDLFEALCLSLIKVIKGISDPSVGISVATEHLKRWKSFLAGKNTHRLSPEQVRGLFAELQYLKKLLEEDESNQRKTLAAWVGPEASHQDFIFSNTAIEIKSLSGKERNAVKISSEDQLEGLADNLYLKIFRLDEHLENEESLSLNEQVKTTENILNNAEDLKVLTDKLMLAGYLPMELYDEPSFSVIEERGGPRK